MSTMGTFSEKKIWGWVTHLFFSDECSISYLQVLPHTFCSIHKHKQRTNVFYLLDGEIDICVWDDTLLPSAAPHKVVTLRKRGDEYSVPKGVWHQFVVKKPGSLIEIYHGTDDEDIVQHEDIVRFSPGGTYDPSE